MNNAPDPSRIMQVGMGFLASKTLLSAVELGVFAALSAGPLTGERMRERLALHRRAAADFFDALVALGFLNRDGNGSDALYANTPETAAYLDPASPSYVGGIFLMANRRQYPHWGGLSEALKTGRPQNEIRDAPPGTDPFGALYATPGGLDEFLSAMAAVQSGNARVLAEKFDFGRYHKLCDVGGGGATVSMAIARRHPQIHCTSLDLPAVTANAARRIEAAGMSGRVTAVTGDFMKEELPAADVVLMGHILHDWGTATKRMLVEKAYRALPEGGTFIAIENIIDDDRRENAIGLLMSLNMLIETPEGYDYTFAQFRDWAATAGFKRMEKMPLAGTYSAVIAWK